MNFFLPWRMLAAAIDWNVAAVWLLAVFIIGAWLGALWLMLRAARERDLAAAEGAITRALQCAADPLSAHTIWLRTRLPPTRLYAALVNLQAASLIERVSNAGLGGVALYRLALPNTVAA